MKKIIVTLCSLALSLAGTFGVNQLASNDEAIIDKNMEQVSVEKDADTVEDVTTLPAEEEKEVKASEVEAAAPKAKEAERKDTKVTNSIENTKDEKVTVSNNKESSTKNTVNITESNNIEIDKKASADEKTVSNNIVKQKTITTDTTQNNTSDKKNNYTDSYKSNGNNVYVYKNIDLSNCKSAEDVVEVLQKNGYKNININNIQNISSLDEILSLIGNNGSQANTEEATPTKAPKETTTTTKPTTPTNSSNSNSSFAEEVLRLVNIERSKAGLSSLTTNSTLKAAADKRAQETAVSFSHTRPNGTKFSTVLQEYGISYRTAGENIAYGQRTPQEVVTGWMNSPGHRANILNGNFNKIGIGVYQSNGVIYWSQLFTN